ncbi:Os07g0408900 [Oryza sativa Japonica Group]|uniref:Os07g0408900 protein n=1 Tax=Oryza sativa subsp. japonica TaxID=39947 RepID=A0A0P0X4P5_ORYSJ|nr:Os07g0408900 [Oryza sativa Japonica Group]
MLTTAGPTGPGGDRAAALDKEVAAATARGKGICVGVATRRGWEEAPACRPPVSLSYLWVGDQGGSFSDLLAFLFLLPCLQRTLLGAVNLVYVIASLVVLVRPRGGGGDTGDGPKWEALLPKPWSSGRPFLVVVTLGASGCLCLANQTGRLHLASEMA